MSEMEQAAMDKILQTAIQWAQKYDDPNAHIVLLVLQGARKSGQDELLAVKCQEFVKDALLPNLKAAQERNIASQN